MDFFRRIQLLRTAQNGVPSLFPILNFGTIMHAQSQWRTTVPDISASHTIPADDSVPNRSASKKIFSAQEIQANFCLRFNPSEPSSTPLISLKTPGQSTKKQAVKPIQS